MHTAYIMTSFQELAGSIEEYNLQLSQVSTALQQENLGDSDKLQLEELQQNLVQLLELSLDQLQQLQQSQKLQTQQEPQMIIQKEEIDNKQDDEWALFQSEIAELDEQEEKLTIKKEDTKDSDHILIHNDNTRRDETKLSANILKQKKRKIMNDPDSKDEECSNILEVVTEDNKQNVSGCALTRHLKADVRGFTPAWTVGEVRGLEGVAVRAPYREAWGGHTHHNAVVMSTDGQGPEQEDEDTMECPEVVVLFSQPTSVSMLPCHYYLSGTCHFMDGSCQYSHGEAVPVDALRPYRAPDPSCLVSGCKVLCQHPINNNNKSGSKSGGRRAGEMWHGGSVVDVLPCEYILSVDCSVCCEVVQCDTDKVVPVTQDGEDDAPQEDTEWKLSDAAPVSLSSSGVTGAEMSSGNSAEQWLLNPAPGMGGLGDWEKHTRGIGSRLMQQMGYVSGTGLGKSGEGRVEPVPAYLYPAGVSLDRCMELREKSGGEDLLQVEKRLKKQQQKEEKRLKRDEERLLSQTSVFDIINNKLAGPKSSASSTNSSGQEKLNVGRQHLKSDSNQALNMKGYHLNSKVKLLQKEIDTLNKSLSRQGNHDKVAAASIAAKLKTKTDELSQVRQAEDRVNSEQRTRKHTKKLLVF